MTRFRDRLVDGPDSLGARMRARRWQMFAEVVPDLADLSVLDLGGRAESWRRASVRPRTVTVVNQEPSDHRGENWIRYVRGNACDPTLFDGDTFDFVYSNSLIEHVGGFGQRRALAHNVTRLAPRHWVQTPYRYFPIEPHWVCPGMQFLPLPARIVVARFWPLAHTRPSSMEEAAEAVLWVELLGAREMRVLFPRSRILFERVIGIPKSVIAVRAWV
jgi:SAM-dependent methyltransferase